MDMVKGKHAVVTGGGTGIGFGIARRLLEEGAARLVICGRREEVLQDAKARLLELVPDSPVHYRVCDVTVEEQVEAVVAAAADERGELDIMVSNAGTGFPNPILEAHVDGWKAMCDLNIIGTLLCTKHAARRMKRKGGSIINISSVLGSKTSTFMGSYSTTKAGLEMLTMCSAHELAPFQIRVNAIRPGYVPTEALEAAMPQSFKDSCLALTPLGRPGTPEEIGDAVLYFASDMSLWTTGQVLSVCGGMNLPVGQDHRAIAELMYGEDVVKACLNEA